MEQFVTLQDSDPSMSQDFKAVSFCRILNSVTGIPDTLVFTISGQNGLFLHAGSTSNALSENRD